MYYLILYGLVSKRHCNRELLTKNVRRTLFILFSGTLLAFLLNIGNSGNSHIMNGNRLMRKDAGKGSDFVNLIARTEDGKESRISFEIEECSYSKEELDDLFAKMKEEILPIILNGNVSFQEIRSDLYLPERVKDYPFEMTYVFDRAGFIDEAGTLIRKEGEPQDIRILVQAEYKDYIREMDILIHICSQEEGINFEEAVQDALLKSSKEGEREIYLPKEINGQKIIWQEEEKKNSLIFFLFSIVAAVLLWIAFGKDEQKKREERVRLMEEEYSTIINKFTMYLNAGQSIKKTWEIIAQKDKDNPIYGEMLYAKREMDSGVRMESALENFAVRVVSKRYARFVTLLVQGQNKGNNMLLHQFREEARVSLEEQQADKKRKGEEASTKLLIPMTIMMAMIMLMIMFPAFLKI